MAVSNFTVKMSGTVAYIDNSHGSFESTITWRGSLGGAIAQHSSTDSEFHFSQLYADKAAGVNAMMAALPGAIILTPAVAAPDRTVSSFVMEISGLVSYDDNTQGAFIVQWVNGVVTPFPAETTEHWAAIVADDAANAILTSAMEGLGGAGNVVITPLAGATSLLAVYSPTSAEVVLTWVDNTTIETGFRVERRTPSGSGAYSILTTLGIDVVTFTDIGTATFGILTGTSFDYRVVAFNADGDAAASNVEAVTT